MTDLDERVTELRREVLARRLAAVTVAEVYRANLAERLLGPIDRLVVLLDDAELVEAARREDDEEASDAEDLADEAAAEDPDDKTLAAERREAAAEALSAHEDALEAEYHADQARHAVWRAIEFVEAALATADDAALHRALEAA